MLVRTTAASFVVISLDGTGHDDLAHYMMGAIAARPTAGFEGTQLERRVFVFDPGDSTDRLADSARECSPLVRIGPERELTGAIREYVERFKTWSARLAGQSHGQ